MTYCHRLHVLAFGLLAGGLLFFTGCDLPGSNMDEEEEQGDASVELSANIQSDRTLSADTDYVVTSSFCVENSSTLTIEAGTRLAFESGTGLKVCGDGSALVAQGTSSNGILMTGTTEQTGFWNGAGLNSSYANNELSYVTIEYAGGRALHLYQRRRQSAAEGGPGPARCQRRRSLLLMGCRTGEA